MTRKLRHSSLATTDGRYDVQVWADVNGDTPHRSVTLYISEDLTTYVDLTLSEARALAALLVMAADQQEEAR